MTLPETIAKDISSLIRMRKYFIVLYVSPIFFGCLAIWFAFRASRSFVGLSLEITANVVLTCLMLYLYKKVVSVLDKTIERMRQPSTLDEYAAWSGMTEAAKKDIVDKKLLPMKKKFLPLTITLNVLLFVSTMILIVTLTHLYFPHR